MAADLVRWLGFDARLLVPASAAEVRRQEEISALAEQARNAGRRNAPEPAADTATDEKSLWERFKAWLAD